MLIRYLTDVKIAYDGINVTHEKKGVEKNVAERIADALIADGRAEIVAKEEPKSDKKLKQYDNKMVDSYENKSVVKTLGKRKKRASK